MSMRDEIAGGVLLAMWDSSVAKWCFFISREIPNLTKEASTVPEGDLRSEDEEGAHLVGRARGNDTGASQPGTQFHERALAIAMEAR